jgi:hypothetical protein
MRHALITIHLLNRACDGAVAQAELAVAFGELAVAI